MDPFTRLPNEIIDAIFIHLRPDEVWKTQECSASTERALDPHLRTRRYAIDELMKWAFQRGINQAVRKAVSLGADVSVIKALPGDRSNSEHSTIYCASLHLETVHLLLDVGARLDIDLKGVSGERRDSFERNFSPEFYQLFSDRGITDQFVDFQDRIDHRLFLQIHDWWRDTRDIAEAMDKISILLELGASSVTLIQDQEEPVGTTLSYLMKCIYDWFDYPSEWFIPTLKLLLSKRPDLNAPSLEITQRFLEDPNVLTPWQAWFCPVAAAVRCMVELGTTEIMDMLLEAGAKLNLPTHTRFQPLALYAYLTKTHDGPGYKYLEGHGATFEPLWHPVESVDDGALIPIFQLCKDLRYFSAPFYDGTLLLDDKLFGVIKLFIERGAVKNVGIRFIENILRPIGDAPYDAERQSTVIERSHILLKLILHENDNLNPNNPGEIDLLLEAVEQTTVDRSDNSNLRFSNIIDPVLVALLLQKGAKLRTRSRTKEFRNRALSHLQRGPYNISLDIRS